MTTAWNPTQYDKFKNERSQPFLDLMALAQSQNQQPTQPSTLPKITKAVDLGCGTGELTALLHQQLKIQKTIAIDSSDEMLQKSQTHTTEGLHFQKSNIETWVPDEKMDLIFSNAALQWCPNHKELMKRLKSFLSPGGQLAIQMPMNHDYPTHTIAHEMSQEPRWSALLPAPLQSRKDSHHMLNTEEYAQLLFDLGFREQKVFLRVYGHELESREQVIEWVKGTTLTRFQSQLSAEDYSRFISEYRQRLFEKLPNQNPFFYPFKRILMWARL